MQSLWMPSNRLMENEKLEKLGSGLNFHFNEGLERIK